MGRPRKEKPILVKSFGTCLEALSFIDTLLKKGNTTGRIQSRPRPGGKLEFDWSVRYTGKEKEKE